VDYNACKHEAAKSFFQFTPAASKDFAAIAFAVIYPKGAILFVEGQQARGVFCLCQGEVKLSISSSEGKRLIIRIVKTGEILGLIAALAGSRYEVTAEAIYPCEAAFVRREDFLRFITKYPEASQIVAKQISSQYQATYEQLRTVGLSASAHKKLARLLLSWSTSMEQTRDGAMIRLSLTHEEIAEFIGTTRETVTRALSEFRHRHLVELHGSTLRIPSRAALETFVGA
jgi:CRP/FNR family transcriptional regulator, cyclic AMP receptor protein